MKLIADQMHAWDNKDNTLLYIHKITTFFFFLINPAIYKTFCLITWEAHGLLLLRANLSQLTTGLGVQLSSSCGKQVYSILQLILGCIRATCQVISSPWDYKSWILFLLVCMQYNTLFFQRNHWMLSPAAATHPARLNAGLGWLVTPHEGSCTHAHQQPRLLAPGWLEATLWRFVTCCFHK